MKIQISDHFTYKRILSFTLPSIIMMVFTSIYSVVDGFFVSNYAGKLAFSAVNFTYPYLNGVGAFGCMFGAGGCALIGKTLGENNRKKANEIFSLIIMVIFLIGTILGIISFIKMDSIVMLLGASENMAKDSILYGRIIVCSLPFFMLQLGFHNLCVVAENPKLGLSTTVVAGVINIVFDFILVGIFKLGIVGAAYATVFSEVVGGISPLLYFVFSKRSPIKFVMPTLDFKAIFDSSTNGISEFISMLSSNLVNILYNAALIKFAGENGVAAFGVIMYLNFVFVSIFLGFAMGTAPLVSYNYGAQNHKELKNLLNMCLKIVAAFSVLMLILGEIFALPLSNIFVGYDMELKYFTIKAFRLFSFSFLFVGVPIFLSSFFTALNNGLVSFLISFFRTMIFQVIAILTFPIIFGLNGVWASLIFAEVVATITSILFLILNAKKYNYV